MVSHPATTEYVSDKQSRFHAPVVEEVQAATGKHDVVVVGMQWNHHVSRARKALSGAGLTHHYLEFGGYMSMWRPRLAIKMWSGWPTYPQVFVRGTLIGGADQVEHMLADGSLRALLDGMQD